MRPSDRFEPDNVPPRAACTRPAPAELPAPLVAWRNAARDHRAVRLRFNDDGSPACAWISEFRDGQRYSARIEGSALRTDGSCSLAIVQAKWRADSGDARPTRADTSRSRGGRVCAARRRGSAAL
jgi:hypothetical protein